MPDWMHWLSYPQQVTYKLCLLTYKSIQGCVLAFLSRLCVPTVPSQVIPALMCRRPPAPGTKNADSCAGSRASSISGEASPELHHPSVSLSLDCLKCPWSRLLHGVTIISSCHRWWWWFQTFTANVFVQFMGLVFSSPLWTYFVSVLFWNVCLLLFLLYSYRNIDQI